ncbi:uncharacterized protein LOC143529697 [Bidens hawaiensis]|uniref:uncharacterized protein LOC143529697 n=1 Tax=Bidens hawaiensis TaxID=980011 RepID=UPI00404B6E2D
MEAGNNDQSRRRKSLQERLGLACCGSTWVTAPSTMSLQDVVDPLPESTLEAHYIFPSPRMNLATALAAERDSGSTMSLTQDNSVLGTIPATPRRMSLMRLLEETDDHDEKGMDSVCCVCMGRKKGAAFIPCGHTFCRVCSRELWLNRGSCPLCNRSILEILDIF